jgi:calmodulin
MKKLGQNPSEFELQQIINEIDIDGNGLIDINEFLTLMARKMKDADTETLLLKAFNLFASEKEGCIDEASLKKALESFGEKFSD